LQEKRQGKKQCPDCKELVGARSLKCKCGFPFWKYPVLSQQKQREEEKKRELPPITGRITISYPAGKCPIKLEELDEPTIREWIYRVLDYGIYNNRNYTIDAIIYFVREFYPTYTSEFQDAKRTIIGILCGQQDEGNSREMLEV